MFIDYNTRSLLKEEITEIAKKGLSITLTKSGQHSTINNVR